MPASERHKFTVDHGGEEYRCERVVTGTRVLTQMITVCGIGSLPDNDYSARGSPLNTMEIVARLIAFNIIQEYKAKKA